MGEIDINYPKKEPKKEPKKKKKRQTIFLIQNSYKTMTCTTMPFRTRTGPFVTSNRKSAFRKKKKFQNFFFGRQVLVPLTVGTSPPGTEGGGLQK